MDPMDPNMTRTPRTPIVPDDLIRAFDHWEHAVPDTFEATTAMLTMQRSAVSFLQALIADGQPIHLPHELRIVITALDHEKRYGSEQRRTVKEAEFRAYQYVHDLVRRQRLAAAVPAVQGRAVTPEADLPRPREHSLVWLDRSEHGHVLSATVLANVRDSLGCDHVVFQVMAAGRIAVLTLPLGEFRAAQERALRA